MRKKISYPTSLPSFQLPTLKLSLNLTDCSCYQTPNSLPTRKVGIWFALVALAVRIPRLLLTNLSAFLYSNHIKTNTHFLTHYSSQLFTLCHRAVYPVSLSSNPCSTCISKFTAARSITETKGLVQMPTSLSTCRTGQLPLVNFQGGFRKMKSLFRPKLEKVVFIFGATGTGKSKLAIDLATRFSAEIVNSDKMQVYKGLEVVTNKVTEEECQGVPHHLLGIADPNSNFTANDFCRHASLAIESIVEKDKLPIIAGGSNSFIEALVNYDAAPAGLRYECCFLWVDVSWTVLRSFLLKRVDRMIEAGLVNEVRQIFDPMADYTRGIKRAIGVPELDKYVRNESIADERTKAEYLDAAIAMIKKNNCSLALRQLQKIERLSNMWMHHVRRIDATEAFKKSGEEAEGAWNDLVLVPSTHTVQEFLHGQNHLTTPSSQNSRTHLNPIVSTEPVIV